MSGERAEAAAAVAMSLWEAIDRLVALIPFNATEVAAALSTTIADTHAPGGGVVQFFEGGPVQLMEDVTVTRIDLRIGREGPRHGFLVLDLQGRCISRQELRRHYASLQLTGVPRGRSLDESTTYTAALEWGRLSFGFSERNPACLAYVAFDPA